MSTFTDNSAIILAKISRALEEAIEETAVDIVHDMAASFNETKTGRTYGDHQASAPGESPAIFSEDLLNSLGEEKVGKFEHQVGSKDWKAALLEGGGVKLEPRPFLLPAVLKNKDKLPQKIRSKVK